jgi:hypothetical protein
MSGLRSGAVVVPQHATKPFTANDLAGRLSDAIVRLDDLVVQRLMVSLRVIMLQELVNCVAKHVLAEEDQSRKAFVLDTLHESFNVRIQIGRPWRKFYSLDAFTFEYLAEHLGELRVAIDQDVSFAEKEAIFHVGQVPGDLLHPRSIWVGCATGEVNAPGSQLHDEEEIERHQPALRPHLDCCEVNRRQDVPMGFEKGGPRCLSLAVRRRLDAMLFEDIAHGLVRNLVSQVGQRPLDTVVAPSRILQSKL